MYTHTKQKNRINRIQEKVLDNDLQSVQQERVLDFSKTIRDF